MSNWSVGANLVWRRKVRRFRIDRTRRTTDTMLDGFTQLFNNLSLFGGDLFHISFG